MVLLLRAEENNANFGLHSLCKRCLCTVSADNLVALLVNDLVYIVSIKRNYADLVAKIEHRVQEEELSDEGSDDGYISVDLSPDECRYEQMQAISSTCVKAAQRFVWAAWTPVFITQGNRKVSALCTANINGLIEIWVPNDPGGIEAYGVQKICDVTSILAEQLKDALRSVFIKGKRDKSLLKHHALLAIEAGGFKMCQFAEPGADDLENGFLGCISCESLLCLVWFSNDPMAAKDGMWPRNVEGRSHNEDILTPGDEGLHQVEPVVDCSALDNHIIKLHDVERDPSMFDVGNIANSFHIPGENTSRSGLTATLVALMETGILSSYAIHLQESGNGRQLYKLFMGTDHANILWCAIEIRLAETIECVVGDPVTLARAPSSVEMLRHFKFHGELREFEILIATAGGEVMVYDLQEGQCHRHQCGPYTLVGYQAEPMFMYQGILAKITVLDAVGTVYQLSLDDGLNINPGRQGKLEQEPMPRYLYNRDKIALQVNAGTVGIDVHYNLVSGNIFATLVICVIEKRGLAALVNLVEFYVNTADCEPTETMFIVHDVHLDLHMGHISKDQFLDRARHEECFSLWRQFMSQFENHPTEKAEIMATSLYLIAYAEAGGNATDKVSLISLDPSCVVVVNRLLGRLQPTDSDLEHMMNIAIILHRGHINKNLIY